MAFETIRGESGVDFIGTDGVDILLSLNESGAKSVVANGGNDNITLEDSTGVVGNATVRGGDGNDTINIGGNQEGTTRVTSSSINGGAGNDTINTDGALQTTIRGNAGEDTLNIQGNFTAAVINGNAGGDVFNLTGATTLEDSKIVGGGDNDGEIRLDGFDMTAVNSTINGNGGNDAIIIGDGGSDLTASSFTVYGGEGEDTITNNFNDVSGTVVYSGDKGNDSIEGGAGTGSLLGGEGNDTLNGGAGDDTIDGGDGIDTINGGADDDVILGGAGNDVIDSGAGDDTITGGAGADTYADENNNTYVFSSIADSAAAFTGEDATFAINFDSFTNNFRGANTVDFTGAANALAGSVATTVNSTAVTLGAGGEEITSAAEFKSELEDAGVLAASATGTIEAYVITIDAAANSTLAGDFFVYLNDTNTISTAGDMMFEVGSTAAGDRLVAALADSLA